MLQTSNTRMVGRLLNAKWRKREREHYPTYLKLMTGASPAATSVHAPARVGPCVLAGWFRCAPDISNPLTLRWRCLAGAVVFAPWLICRRSARACRGGCPHLGAHGPWRGASHLEPVAGECVVHIIVACRCFWLLAGVILSVEVFCSSYFSHLMLVSD